MGELVDKFLAVNTAPPVPARKVDPEKDFTQQVEVNRDDATVTLRDKPANATEGAAREALAEQGLDPAEWEVSTFRTSRWTMANGEEGVSKRFGFRRTLGAGDAPRADIDELVGIVGSHQPAPAARGAGEAGYIVALGDGQAGKAENDAEGLLRRSLDYLDEAANRYDWYRTRFNLGHVHVAWLGDHIEGFVSQGGANAWRTTLTLSEQLRLTRRVMLYAVERFAPLASRVTMAACPGNHGDTVRFNGKSQGTRYDDSHDTECLIAVAEAVALNPAAFGHVKFYTPETDEMTVVLEVAGTIVAHAHGHQWRPGQHFKWWEGQSFGNSPLREADLLLAGHLHHTHIEERGERLFVQVPALESHSQWWKNATGQGGYPGLLTAVVQDGRVISVEMVRK